MEYYGINFLQFKLAMKRIRVELRYLFYEMQNIPFDFGISTPPELKYFNSVIGWCAKGVDSLADRLDFAKFDNEETLEKYNNGELDLTSIRDYGKKVNGFDLYKSGEI